MKRINRFLLLAAAAIAPAAWAAEPPTQQIFINEVMQSTFGGQLDQLLEYPDGWVELYNPSDAVANLKGYRIGKKKFSKCFKLPSVDIEPKGYLVIMCDKEEVTKTYTSLGGKTITEIHTDFRITTDKESEITLFAPDESVVDLVELPVMVSPNISWGRAEDGSERMGWQLTTTQGQSNQGGLAKKVLPNPVLSSKSIVTANGEKAGFNLTASYPEDFNSSWDEAPNLRIRYTLDGSEPTLYNSEHYTEPINTTQNVIFRAKMFADSCIAPMAPAQVMINVGHNITLPVVSIVADDDDLNNEYYGILANNKGEGSVKNDWRRPAFLDFFAQEGEATLSQRCEIRVAGGWSRSNPIKSFQVYASDRFGTPDYFEQQFFPYSRPQNERFASIMLRSAGNDYSSSYMRDGVVHMIMGGKVDVDWQAFQPAIYYINLQYQGIINIRERSNEDNIWTNYDGLEDITMVENDEVKEGEYQQYRDFCDFFNTAHTFEEINALMDVDEYLNHMIMNCYMCNTDFPGNNNVMWRPIADGGRWRWILKDVDRSFNIWGSLPKDFNYLKWMLEDPHTGDANTPEGTKPIKYLMKNDEFRQKFIDRYTVLIGDVFRPERVDAIINWCYDAMKYEWQYFKNGNNTWGWAGEVNNMKTWNRDRYQWMQSTGLKDYFKLGNQVPTTVNIDNALASQSTFAINGTPLSQGDFDGSLYAGRTYTIAAADKDGKPTEVRGWQVITTSTSGAVHHEFFKGSEVTITPKTNTKNLIINASTSETSVKRVAADKLQIVETTYINTLGQSSAKPFRGLNIVRHLLSDGSVLTEKKLVE